MDLRGTHKTGSGQLAWAVLRPQRPDVRRTRCQPFLCVLKLYLSELEFVIFHGFSLSRLVLARRINKVEDAGASVFVKEVQVKLCSYSMLKTDQQFQTAGLFGFPLRTTSKLDR